MNKLDEAIQLPKCIKQKIDCVKNEVGLEIYSFVELKDNMLTNIGDYVIRGKGEQ
jgi:hypothetical protein